MYKSEEIKAARSWFESNMPIPVIIPETGSGIRETNCGLLILNILTFAAAEAERREYTPPPYVPKPEDAGCCGTCGFARLSSHPAEQGVGVCLVFPGTPIETAADRPRWRHYRQKG